MSSDLVFNVDILEAELCRQSFADFVMGFWETVVPEQLKWNWHMQVLCDELQDAAERLFRGEPRKYDLFINVPPGTSKSTICSVMFPAWVWTRMNTARFICTSYAHPLALELADRCRRVLRSEKYAALFPEVQIRKDQDQKTNFALNTGGQRYAAGSGGTILGLHAHFIIIDDPLDPQMAASELMLKETNNWIVETLSGRKVDRMLSLTVTIMQRLAQHDPTGIAIAPAGGKPRDDIRHICLPAELSDNVKPPELKQLYLPSGLLDPVRLPKAALERERKKGTFFFSCQYRQNPIPEEGVMFRTKLLIQDQHPPGEYKQVVRYWDKAGTAGGGAFTVGVKMAEDLHGRFWVLEVVRGQWDTARREAQIRATAFRDGTGVLIGIEQEPGSGGKESAENTVRSLAGYMVEVDKPSGNEQSKVMRADPFSAQVNIGNVALNPAGWNADYVEELAYFPYSQYKDQVDSSSGAFNLLMKPRITIGGWD